MENDIIQIFSPNFSKNGLASVLLFDSEFSDVTLVCADNKQLSCHRAVLASSSSFLRELLSTSIQQNTFLYLGKVQKDQVQSLLEYIYLGQCSVQKESLGSLLALAGELGVDEVQPQKHKEQPQDYKIQTWPQDQRQEDTDEGNYNENENENKKKIKEQSLEKYIKSNDYDTDINKVHQNQGTWFSKFEGHSNYEESSEKVIDSNMMEVDLILKDNPRLDDSASSQPKDNIRSKWELSEIPPVTLKVNSIGKEKKTKHVKPWSSIVVPVPDNDGNIPCEECSQFFTTNDRYKNHRLAKHELAHIAIPTPDENGAIQCPDCGPMSGGFMKETLYRRHRWVKHDGQALSCSYCTSKFSVQKELNHHIKTHDDLTFPCEYCETNSEPLSNSESEDFLNNHKLRRLLKCNKCEFEACKKAVRCHYNTVHNPLFYQGLYNCDRCKFKNTVYERMKKHIAQNHEKNRVSCDQCDFTALRPDRLLEHKQSKHDNLTYGCKQCDFRAIRLYALKIHEKNKHDGSSFQTKNSLYNHRQTKHSNDKKLKNSSVSVNLL